jgi:hypothetical protein
VTPSVVEWTSHARAKADQEAWVPTDVEDAIATHHDERQGNPGAADS